MDGSAVLYRLSIQTLSYAAPLRTDVASAATTGASAAAQMSFLQAVLNRANALHF